MCNSTLWHYDDEMSKNVWLYKWSEILEWDKSYTEADLVKAVDFHLHFNPSVFTTEIFCKEKNKGIGIHI